MQRLYVLHRTGSRALVSSLVVPLFALFVSFELAAAPQQARAADSPSHEVVAARFRLADVHISDADALPPDQLRPLVAPYLGRDVSLVELEQLANAITSRYRESGYFLAQAFVPAQSVKDGIVEIKVVEGRLGKIAVKIAPDAPINEARVRSFLGDLQTGRALNARDYERAMLLLSDQPGLKVTSGLAQGEQTGTTDLTVEINAAPRFKFLTDLDNQGSKELGRYRIGGTVRWASPLGIGDSLDARLLASDSTDLTYGRLAYEAPIASNGLRAGVGVGRVSYELGGAFEPLDARGTADVLDAFLSYPVIRQRQQNLWLRLSADSKRLTDEFRAVSFESKKRSNGVGLGWTWERRDEALGGGVTGSTGNLYRGDLTIRDAQSLAFDQSVAGHNTDGSFTKFNAGITRLQAVLPRHSIFVSLALQRSGGNLDPSEKFALGGARAVRAYAGGEALVDEGQLATIEWRWAYSDSLTPHAFYDAARGNVVRRPTPFDGVNSVSLRGFGFGVTYTRSADLLVNATIAWRDGTQVAQTDGGGKNPRLYFQLQKGF